MTKIDSLFTQWQSEQTEEALNKLLTAVRSIAMQMAGGDDDVAQETCIVVAAKLADFVPMTESSFDHWVRSITSNVRKGEKRKAHRRREDVFDERQVGKGSNHLFLDLNDCPKAIRDIAAKLIHGHCLEEIAGQLGVKPDSIRRKVARWCPE